MDASFHSQIALECRCACINAESSWHWSSHFNLCANDMLVDGNFTEECEYITFQPLR